MCVVTRLLSICSSQKVAVVSNHSNNYRDFEVFVAWFTGPVASVCVVTRLFSIFSSQELVAVVACKGPPKHAVSNLSLNHSTAVCPDLAKPILEVLACFSGTLICNAWSNSVFDLVYCNLEISSAAVYTFHCRKFTAKLVQTVVHVQCTGHCSSWL